MIAPLSTTNAVSIFGTLSEKKEFNQEVINSTIETSYISDYHVVKANENIYKLILYSSVVTISFSDYPIGVIVMNRKTTWLQKMETKHYAWLIVTTLLGVIGLTDLIQFAISGVTIFHWLNDILLIFCSLALSITVAMVVMEE